MAHRVLVVEDEDDIALPLVRTLEREGYEVNRASSGNAALALLHGDGPYAMSGIDVLILDRGLGDIDGVDLCRQVREEGFAGAILIVTARDGELDRVVGLDYGADDYLAKPFGLAELLARVRALLRRTQAPRPAAASAPTGALVIDEGARRVFANGVEVLLTGKEFDVLALLAREREKVVTRQRLMADIWDENWYGSTKTLDVTIGRLRSKLGEVETTDRVVAVRGVGFRLESEGTRPV